MDSNTTNSDKSMYILWSTGERLGLWVFCYKWPVLSTDLPRRQIYFHFHLTNIQTWELNFNKSNEGLYIKPHAIYNLYRRGNTFCVNKSWFNWSETDGKSKSLKYVHLTLYVQYTIKNNRYIYKSNDSKLYYLNRC